MTTTVREIAVTTALTMLIAAPKPAPP